MNLRDIIAKIKLTLDKTSAAKVDSEVKSTFGGITSMAKAAGAAIAAAFSITVITAFARASVAAALESEVAWNRVAGAVERSGVSWKRVEGKVRAAADAMRHAAGIGDEQFAEAFDRLLGLTNDFGTSLQHMGLAADVAAKFYGGDMVQAADLLGRTLSGNTRGLRALGISTDNVNDGLRILAERSAGAAAGELNTLAGAARGVRAAFDEAQESVGDFLLRLVGGTDEVGTSATRIISHLDRIANWFATHKFVGWMRGGPIPIPIFGKRDAPTDASGNPLLADPKIRIPGDDSGANGGTTGPQLIGSGARDVARMMIDNAHEQMRAELEAAANTRSRAGELRDKQGRIGNAVAGMLGGFMFPGARGNDEAEMEENRRKQEEHWGRIGDAATNAAYGVAGAWQDTFALLAGGFGNAGEAAKTFFGGLAGAGAGALAQYASGKVAENTALAVEEVAKGLAAAANPLLAWSAPGHFFAAKQHGGAAALWAALAGTAGGAQSAIAGGGRGGMSGGIPSGASDIGGRIAERSERATELHFHIDWFNKSNARHNDIVGPGVVDYLERAGYKIVKG